MKTQANYLTLGNDQDVTDLIGHVIFNRDTGRIQKIIGNVGFFGHVAFSNDPTASYWIGTYHLRTELIYNDITGMGPIQVRRAVGNHPMMNIYKGFHIKQMLSKINT